MERIVSDWVAELEAEQLFGPDDPLFPATAMGLDDDGHFAPTGLSRENWSNAGPSRKIFRAAFEQAGLPYFNPHSFRKTLVSLGQSVCRTPEELRHGAKTLAMKMCSPRFEAMEPWRGNAREKSSQSLRHTQNGDVPRLDPQARQVLERLLRE